MMDIPTEKRAAKEIEALLAHNATITREMEAEFRWINQCAQVTNEHLMEMRHMRKLLDSIMSKIAEQEEDTPLVPGVTADNF